ncbi:MAG: hypothetical protein V3V90_07905 [Thermodesulfobacteriota bacterium]
MIIEPKIREKDGEKLFLRLTLNQRMQHILLLVSFAILTLTGLPMKYFDTAWGTFLYPLLGGIEWAPIIHRVSAIVIILTFFYHIGYCIAVAYTYYLRPLKQDGRLTLFNVIKSILSMPMIPNLEDLRESKEILLYYFFLSSNKPVMRRFGVREKLGYWAVFWGMPVLGISGWFLWAEGIITRYLPGIVLNLSYLAHTDEALLAAIVIFIWHLYNTHISLSKFPMGMSWFTGYENEEEMMEEHYAHYVDTMKQEGREAEIKEEKEDPFEGQSPLIKMFNRVYLVTLMVILTSTTIFISIAIYQTTFGHLPPPSDAPIAKKESAKLERLLEKIVVEDKEKEKFYRGYRITAEKELKGYYHNIALKVGPDNRSHCIKCHGDFPHGETKQIRAFLNMHAFFLTCETCHIRPEENEETFLYQWYDRESGEIVEDPEIGAKPIDALDLRLVPCRMEEGKLIREDSDERIRFTKDFIRMVEDETLGFEEEKEKLKKIHDHINPESIQCQECHTKDKPFLPYEKIGYSQRRIGYLCSDEISRMIREHELFVSPTPLKEWEEEK